MRKFTTGAVAAVLFLALGAYAAQGGEGSPPGCSKTWIGALFVESATAAERGRVVFFRRGDITVVQRYGTSVVSVSFTEAINPRLLYIRDFRGEDHVAPFLRCLLKH